MSPHLAFPTPIAAAAAAAFAAAFAGTWAARRLAPRWGMVARPRADRWHQRPTPLLGGIGIFVGFFAAWLFFRPRVPGAAPVLLAAAGLFATGLVDDIWALKPYAKLSLQMLAASTVIFAGLVLPWTPFHLVNDLLTILWITGVTNAVNLLDNMDGLAAGVALIASTFQILFFLQNGQPGPALLAAILAGTVAAFLRFNFSPASIFMGDCGSLFLGFMLGSLVLFSNWQRSRGLVAVLITPVLIVLVPIVDTTLVTLMRIGHGRPVSQGGRDHSSHRLVALGLSERNAVLVLMGLSALGGGFALLLQHLEAETLYALIPCFALVVLFFAIRLGMVKVYGPDQGPPAPFSYWISFSYRKRILEVLLDLGLMAVAYFGAFLLRFGGTLPADQLRLFNHFIPLVLGVEVLVFLLGGMYGSLWHLITIEDVPIIVRCVFLGALLAALGCMALQFRPRLSLSVLVLNGILLLLLAGGSRAALRLVSSWLQRHAQRDAAVPVLIYGAGAAGELLARELQQGRRYLPVGFLDDDEGKVGRRLRGLQIYARDDWARVARDHAVREVLVSSASIPGHRAVFDGLPVQQATVHWPACCGTQAN